MAADPVQQDFSSPWGPFDFNSENVQEQIVSTLSHVLQNISFLYNGSSLLNPLLDLSYSTSTAQEAIYDNMKNLTFSIFSDTFTSGVDGSSSFLLKNLEAAQVISTIFYFGVLVQYLAAFVTTLVGGWILNRVTLKNEIITDILETVISFFIVLPALPAIAVFLFGILVVRTLIMIYLKVTYPDGKISMLNPVDGFWAFEDFASCSTCLGLYIIEGSCDIEKIRARQKKTIESDLVGGKMTRKLITVFGFSCWETIPKEEMDMRKYVRRVNSRGEEIHDQDVQSLEVMREKDVFQVMRIIQDKPIENKAPWEMVVIPKFTYDKGESSGEQIKHYAVIYRIHHAIMDGISTANVLHSVMADKPFEFSLDPIKPLGRRKASTFETGLLYFLGLMSMPRVTLRNLFLVDNYQNKYCLPGHQLTGPKTLSWSRPIKMDALKAIKTSTETSIYTVLLSSLGGAVRQFHVKNGIKIDCENYHVMTPIALLPYPDRKPRNRFTGVLMPTNVEEKNLSPVERLHKNFNNLKALGSSSATFLAVANWYFPVFLGFLPLFLHKPLSLLIHLKMSLSNVPGPAEDVFIYEGGKIVDIGIWLPIKYSLGLGMGLFSYKDKVRACVVGDKAYYQNDSDIEFLTNAFENELTLLGRSIGMEDIFVSE